MSRKLIPFVGWGEAYRIGETDEWKIWYVVSLGRSAAKAKVRDGDRIERVAIVPYAAAVAAGLIPGKRGKK